MGSKQHVELKFTQEFRGYGQNDRGAKVPIGSGENEQYPYEMLFMALGSCLYSTFLDVTKKMKLNYDTAVIDIRGEKREEIPATLKNCHVHMTVKNCSDEKKAKKAMDLACQYCSIYQTISHVAEMQSEIVFQ